MRKTEQKERERVGKQRAKRQRERDGGRGNQDSYYIHHHVSLNHNSVLSD